MSTTIEFDASEYSIDSVNLYFSDRADVNRKFKLSYEGGKYEVRITNLPSCIQKNSIRACLDDNRVIVLRVTQDNILADALAELYRKKEQTLREKDIVCKEMETLRQIFTGPPGGFRQNSQPGPGFKQVEKEPDGLTSRFLELIGIISKYREKEMSIEDEIANRRESCLDSSVTVYFDAPEAGETTLSLTYLVNNVFFKPNYDIHASLSEREGGPKINILRVIYQASLEQSTGEDWKNVILKASTFNPTENVVIPDDSQNWAPQKPYKDVISCSESTSYSPLREVITLSGLYTISHKTKTQEFQNIVIADLNFTEVKLDWVLVPALSQSVLLKATIRNTSDYFLLAGSAKIMLDDMLVGNTTIPKTREGEFFVCSLGAEQKFRVVDHVVDHYRETEATHLNERRYHLSIKHGFLYPIRVIVRGRVDTSDGNVAIGRLLESAQPSDPTRGRYDQSNPRLNDLIIIGTPEDGSGMAISNGGVSLSPNGSFERTIEINPGETVELLTEISISIPRNITRLPIFNI